MILLSLQKSLTNTNLTEKEKKLIKEDIKRLELKMEMS